MRKRRGSARACGGWALGILLLAVTFALPAHGQSLNWVIQAGSSELDRGNDIALDGAGNSFVTGSFNDTARFGIDETNESLLESFGNEDIFVAKFARDGTLVWVRQSGGSGIDIGNSIAVDNQGNSYVTGLFSGTVTFGQGETNQTTLKSSDEDDVDIFVAKYARDGNLIWAQKAGGRNRDVGHSIAVDNSGALYVAGVFTGSAVFGRGGENEISIDANGLSDNFIAKYGREGNLVWVTPAGNSINADAGPGPEIAVDRKGDSYVTGYFLETTTFGLGESEETVLIPVGQSDIFVAKFADDGTLMWARQAGGSGTDIGNSIAVDKKGNSYVTGDFSDTAIFGSGESNETVLDAFFFRNMFVAKYASDGSLLWAKQADSPTIGAFSFGAGITVDQRNNSYVTGNFGGETTFGLDEDNETVLAGTGMFVAKYADDGNLLWVISGGSEAGGGNAITIGRARNIYVIGVFNGTAIFGAGEDNETILESFGDAPPISASNNDIFVAKFIDRVGRGH